MRENFIAYGVEFYPEGIVDVHWTLDLELKDWGVKSMNISVQRIEGEDFTLLPEKYNFEIRYDEGTLPIRPMSVELDNRDVYIVF